MGCWCSSAKPPQQSGVAEGRLSFAEGTLAENTSHAPAPVPAKSSFQLSDQNLLLTVRSNRELFDPTSVIDSGCGNARDHSSFIGGIVSARESLRQRALSKNGCQPLLLNTACGGLRALQNSDFEDHAPMDVNGDGEIPSGAGSFACNIPATLGCRTFPNTAVSGGGGENGGGTAIASSGIDYNDVDTDGDLLKTSRHLLQSVVPLLSPANAPATSAARKSPGELLLAGGRAAALRLTAASAAEAPPLRSAAAAGGGPLNPNPATGSAKRPTFIRGLTRDSFLLNNTTTTGGTTAYSGYMLRTATGRGDLLHADNCWPPFQMGNPLLIQIGELLGRGGCGSVYRGHWQGRSVAVKVVQQVMLPPAGAAATPGAASGGGGGALLPPPIITPLVDYFGSSSGNARRDIKGDGGGGGGGGGARPPHLPDAHISVKRLRHHNVLRTYAYAVLSAAPQLDGVLPARHEHHVVLELCDGGSLRGWLDRLCGIGGVGAGAVGPVRPALPTAFTVPRETRQQPVGSPATIHHGDGVGGGPDLLTAAQLTVRSALDRAQAPVGSQRSPQAQDNALVQQLKQQQQNLLSNDKRLFHQPSCEEQQPGPHSGLPVPTNPLPPQRQEPQPQLHPYFQLQLQQQSPGPYEESTATDENSPICSPRSLPPVTEEDAEVTPSRISSSDGATAAAAAKAPKKPPSPLPSPVPPPKRSQTGAAAADFVEHNRSSQSASEAISRRLPGLTPAQSEQLQLLGMDWVSDSQVRLGGEGDCLAACGDGGGGGTMSRSGSFGRGGGGGGECSWMACNTDGGKTGGGATQSMSSTSAGRAQDAAVAAAVACRGGAAAANGAPDRHTQVPMLLPPAAQLTVQSGSEDLAPEWVDTTVQTCTAYANASVGSGAFSTMVRPENSSCVGLHVMVQQHCMVLDDDLDDENDGGDDDGGNLRLHERLGLVEEASGEGLQSSRSRCASASATATFTDTTAATGGATTDAPALARHATQVSTLSSGGGGSGACSGLRQAEAPPQQQPPTAPAPTQLTAADHAVTQPPLEPHPQPLGHTVDAIAAASVPQGAATAVAAGPLQLGLGSPPAAGATAGDGADVPLATAAEQQRFLPLFPGKELPHLHPPPGIHRPQLGSQESPPPQPEVTEMAEPLQGEFETSTVTALLNRRMVGMVNSILRSAATGSTAAVGGSSGGIDRATTALPPAVQPQQLRHLVAALGCCVEIASGLSYLHSVGMVHGDVKSGNVLLKMDPRHPRGFVLKLADFGFSRVLENGSHTYLSRPSGTLAYLSPEMLTSYRQSPAADQYAFGLLVWEVVTAQPLFRGLQTPQLLYAKTHNADWQYLTWPPWCPVEVRTLARRCTDFNPAARLTAVEAREQLEAMKAHYQGMLSQSSGGADTDVAPSPVTSQVSSGKVAANASPCAAP